MAGSTDPLEEMLFSEVDEKALSDLVGSLESQLAWQESAGVGGGIGAVRVLSSAQQPHRTGGLMHSARTAIVDSRRSLPLSTVSTLPAAAHVNSKGRQQPPHVAPPVTTLISHSAPAALMSSPVTIAPINPCATATKAMTSNITLVNLSPMRNSAPATTSMSSPVSVSSLLMGISTSSNTPPATTILPGTINSTQSAMNSHFRQSTNPGPAPLTYPSNETNTASLSSSVNCTSSNITVLCSAKPATSVSHQGLLQGNVLCGANQSTVPFQRFSGPAHIAAITQNGHCSSFDPVFMQNADGGRHTSTPTSLTHIVNHQNSAISHCKLETHKEPKSPIVHHPGTGAVLCKPTTSLPMMTPANSLAPHSLGATHLSSNTAIINPASKPPLYGMGHPSSVVGAMQQNLGLPGQMTGVMQQSTAAAHVMSTTSLSPSPMPSMGTAQRIVAPPLVVRPPQQATIQLPPGFTVPPGMVLIRTESGQLLLLPQQALAQAQVQAQTPGPSPTIIPPRLPVTSGSQVFHLSGSQQTAAVATSSVHLAPPDQAKVVQCSAKPASSSVVTLQGSTALSHTQVSLTNSGNQNLFRGAAAGGTPAPHQPSVITGGVTPVSSPRPPTGLPCFPPPPHTAAQIPLQPQVIPSSPVPGTTLIVQEMQENVKKCKNFLATLIKLASHNSPSPETSRNVKSLVQDLLDAKIDAEEFTSRLQSELKSSPQPYLVPFLKKSLPALRQSLLNSQHSVVQAQQQSQQQQTKSSQVLPRTATPYGAAVSTNSTIGLNHHNRICTVTASNPTQLSQVKMVPSCQTSQTASHSSQALNNPSTSCQSTNGRTPVLVAQNNRIQGTVGKVPTIHASRSPGGFGVQVSANPKNKLNDPGGGPFRDDDINDVTSMGGVNLNEESARILATNSGLIGTQIHSCIEHPFLAAVPLHERILKLAKTFGVTDVPTEVVTFISHATQNRLREVVEKITIITRHRMESYKEYGWYNQATDVRSQLKFFEQLERLEKQRKDEEEREVLLKAAKSRSKQEDPEQARLKQKAKEMQQLELEQIRQRDANRTALDAIGPRRKRRLDAPGPVVATAEGVGVSSGSRAALGIPSSRHHGRHRITRVNLRDFIFCLEQERETSRSLLLYRALLK
ncbi:transcription initiation factor TFIID subunit 4-like isoform X2 [Ambystoma mexicanum]|uniref:transcription initiation factor TFIID subunit 4-like isoform X2 n=1 Tax=Ambystoma mexicanum TaxID=8296 RepID=UPI0037E94421